MRIFSFVLNINIGMYIFVSNIVLTLSDWKYTLCILIATDAVYNALHFGNLIHFPRGW